MLRAEADLSDSIELVELNTLIQSKEAGIVASGWSLLEEPSALVTHGTVTALDPVSSFEIFSAPQSCFKPDLLSSAGKFGTVLLAL